LETANKHHWQEALALASLIDDEKKLGDCQFDLWKQYYVAACVVVFGKLRHSRRAVHLQRGGPHGIANAGDSRVVLGTATTCHAVQLIIEAQPACKSLLTGHEFLCVGTTVVADVV
jgi:hypothetical protein